jgi:hypothetical protein
MTWYLYKPQLALDGTTGALAHSGVGQVAETGDPTASAPLTVYTLAGLPITDVQVGGDGLIQAFMIEDVPEALWVSGDYIVPIDSVTGMRIATEAAAVSAGNAQVAAETALSNVQAFIATYQGEGTGGTGTTIIGAPAFWPSAFTPTEHTHPAAEISDSGAIGRAVLKATSQQAARAAIGAGTGNGTSNLQLGPLGTDAAAGNHSHNASALPFDPAGTVLTATDVRGAIIQAAGMGGTSGGSSEIKTIVYASGAFPVQSATAPVGVKVRMFFGPVQYTGPTFAGIVDIHFIVPDLT